MGQFDFELARAEAEAEYVGRDVQFEPYSPDDPHGAGQTWMTEAQLVSAAQRLNTKTRLAGPNHPSSGRSDFGTDAALVARAYLAEVVQNTEARDIINRAAALLDGRPPRPQVDLTKLRIHPSIQLASGNYYDFIAPETTPLDISDIAAGLSRICRYTGQLDIDEDDIYSVAQHCVLASENCDPDCDPFEALMHDRFESVGNDMASPLKQLLLDYKEIEDRCERATADQYGLSHPMSDACKRIDMRMLATEKRDLMPKDDPSVGTWDLIKSIEPLPFVIKPWRPGEARHRFMHRFNYLRFGIVPAPTDLYATPHADAPLAWIAALADAWGYDPRYPEPKAAAR